eukprot:scaffold5347_cov130-Cylindrotheca_fusiformis.AAC.11
MNKALLVFLLHCCGIVLSSYSSSRRGGNRLEFYDGRFRDRVQNALKAVGTILNTTRNPVLLEQASNHTYEDKYALVDTMTNTLIASAMTIFEKLGLSNEMLMVILTKVHDEKRTISLHFQLDQTCTFDKQTERKVVLAETEIERHHTSGSGIAGGLFNSHSEENVKVKTTVQEYHWNVTTPYQLYLQMGDDETRIQLMSRNDKRANLIVSGGSHSSSSRRRDDDDDSSKNTRQRPSPPPIDSTSHRFQVDLTWLFQQIILDDDNHDHGTQEEKKKKKKQPFSNFSIDRLAETCKTPRRNQQIEKAFQFHEQYRSWMYKVSDIFSHLDHVIVGSGGSSFETDDDETSTATTLHDAEVALKHVFIPIIPLFENSAVLPSSDFDLFLSKHRSSLDEFVNDMKRSKKFSRSSFVSQEDAIVVGLLKHLQEVILSWSETVDYVEDTLRNQLIQAIGKELTAEDFDKFIGHYSKTIFAENYAPRPFSYAVRREDHYPDGMVSIERDRTPVDTIVRRISGSDNVKGPSISIPVDAATSVTIQGDCFIHGWIQHRWGIGSSSMDEDFARGGGGDLYECYLVARAHQFSSFMIILGVMGGANTFIPKDAIILQNKDEVLIPLLTNVLPSAKEFKDSIASLSPEQRAFAESYRKMQLESSVFGVCIIQIKPQLERVLNLPEGALTKEIQLTQDLMSLFVEHQIPSDLLSFDGASDSTTKEKVETVKNYTAAVMDVIEKAKQKQLEEEKQRAKMREKMNKEAYSTRTSANLMSSAAGGTIMYSGGPPPGSGRQSSRRLMQEEVFFDEMLESNYASPDEADSGPDDGGPSDESFTQRTDEVDDFTSIPTILDAKFEMYDKDGALKSTLIKAGRSWTRSRQENLLVESRKTVLDSNMVSSERNKAMDLLIAISRSGSLQIESSSLHVVIAVSHCFEKHIMETIIEDNINPIEKMKRSMIMIGAVIHNIAESDFVADKKKHRLEAVTKENTLA